MSTFGPILCLLKSIWQGLLAERCTWTAGLSGRWIPESYLRYHTRQVWNWVFSLFHISNFVAWKRHGTSLVDGKCYSQVQGLVWQVFDHLTSAGRITKVRRFDIPYPYKIHLLWMLLVFLQQIFESSHWVTGIEHPPRQLGCCTSSKHRGWPGPSNSGYPYRLSTWPLISTTTTQKCQTLRLQFARASCWGLLLLWRTCIGYLDHPDKLRWLYHWRSLLYRYLQLVRI